MSLLLILWIQYNNSSAINFAKVSILIYRIFLEINWMSKLGFSLPISILYQWKL